ncbi:hypothetical protein C468_00695 [Halorubrum kocurii JCM 14978]|uniref:Uncharacterized protein n=1 Tax=Halorubrum kocurii JCM 14978 TaxID=1230456 RepID=M0PJC8_9EURY|nr:hypothetical protein C468_00695 [Halorubrum kocurii JCM 14978]
MDIAADNPGATLAEIAEQIPSVSADHVDRVLDQYGDPAASDESDPDQSSSGPPDENSNADADLDSKGSSDGQATTEATNQAHELSSETDKEPDGPSVTEPPETASQMDPETEADTTEPGVEPEPAAEAGPSDKSAETAGSGADTSSPTNESIPDPEGLTQKERETLRAISYEPTATQNQIADMLGVSRATVSNRVNAIPGFNWADRDSFVEEVFDDHLTVDVSVSPNGDDGSAATQNTGKEAVTDGSPSRQSEDATGDSSTQEDSSAAADGVVDGTAPTAPAPQAADRDATTEDSDAASSEDLDAISHQLDDFAERLAAVEQELQDDGETGEGSPFSDTDLLHKVVYACMNSDRIVEEEELQILDALVN